MKKSHLSISGYIHLMIILLLLLEAGWLYSLYHAERRDFRYVTGKFIEDAIKEEIYTCPIQETNGLDDFSMKGRLIMTYTYKGKYFHIDTNSQLFLVFYRRKLYDFNRESWNIDSLAACFRHFCPWEDLNPVFIRQDTTGKIIDRYPADCRKPYRQPDFAQFQLGNLEPDTLTAWFDFPFNRFWLRQRYGLLLSIVPFLFALSFGLLILRREKRRQRNHLLTEKQLIFIHDLKNPFCTSCHIEQHLLQHVGEWPAEKIHEKLNVCRHLLAAITDEMTQLIDRSAGYWGTNPETAGFDLRSMLEEVAARYGGRGDASRIAVDYRLDTPIVQGDSFHLSHIIGNLIDNALRHAGPEANVTVICDADRRGRLRLTVEDNGTGIPRRLHRRIFRPGFRSVPTGDNHGIGLAYIRNTARRIGARLRLDSRPGHGSRFILTFTPGQKHRSRKIHLSPRFYSCFIVAIMFAALFWTGNLYIADRRAFVNEELPNLDEAIFKNNKNFFKWREDTNCFCNDFEAKTITVTHNGQDTTLAMGTHINQSHIYQRLSYDLRDTTNWSIDSLLSAYRKYSANRLPVVFRRIDAAGRTTDRAGTEQQALFLPVECSLPLGYVEGHRLEVQFAYPWLRLFSRYGFGLFLALAGLSVTIRFNRIATDMARRQQAFIRFQREEVQLFIRSLQPRLRDIRYPQTADPEILGETLDRNIGIYRELLGQINLLLEKFKTIEWE